ncbi:MAG: hypothetical protein ACRD0B_00215 [Acidimicrobiales bacterium]
MRQRRVYVAHPMSCYGTEHAASSLARVGELLPGARLIDPERAAWPSDEEWRTDWRDILESLDALIVFAAKDRTVGTGCVSEATDAFGWSLPVAALDATGLRSLDAFKLLPEHERTPRRFARLSLGPLVDLAEFPGGST